MPHYQADQLRETMRLWFFLPDNALRLGREELGPHLEKSLRIFDPVSRVILYASAGVDFVEGRDFAEDRLVRSASVQFDWPGDGQRERSIAARIGLDAPAWTTERRMKWPGPRPTAPGQKRRREFEEVRVPPRALCPVEGPDQAADLCLVQFQ